MTTQNPRLSITLDEETRCAVHNIARHRKMSSSAVAKQLIIEALEFHEDMVLSKLAAERLKKPYKPIPYEEVRKEALRRD